MYKKIICKLIFNFIDETGKTNQNWEIIFKLQYVKPWNISQYFKVKQKSWWDDYIQNDDENFR